MDTAPVVRLTDSSGCVARSPRRSRPDGLRGDRDDGAGRPSGRRRTTGCDRCDDLDQHGRLHADHRRAVREPIDGFLIVDGIVEIDAFGACNPDPGEPTIEPDAPSDPCETEFRTLQVAVEAFFAQYGEFPANGDALVADGFLRELPFAYRVVDGEIIHNDGIECPPAR